MDEGLLGTTKGSRTTSFRESTETILLFLSSRTLFLQFSRYCDQKEQFLFVGSFLVFQCIGNVCAFPTPGVWKSFLGTVVLLVVECCAQLRPQSQIKFSSAGPQEPDHLFSPLLDSPPSTQQQGNQPPSFWLTAPAPALTAFLGDHGSPWKPVPLLIKWYKARS